MKNKIAYFLLFALTICAACSDDFLEIRPDTALTDEQFMAQPNAANGVLSSAYNNLRDKAFMGGEAWILSDMMADNIDTYGLSGDRLAHYTWTTDIFLGTTRGLMEWGGKAIGSANYLLKNIDLAPNLTDADKSRMRGECLFIRAVAHFELVRFFGQPYGYTADNSHLGIAIRTEYGGDTTNRKSVGAVYQQIIADLTEAATLLPAQNGNHATVWAAKAYLAKVYFQMNDFQNAYDKANEVIASGLFSLDTDLSKRFSSQASSESIFALVSSSLSENSGEGLRNAYRLQPTSPPKADVYLSSNLYGAATNDPNDLRGQQWYTVLEGERTLVVCNKFQTNEGINVPLAHLSELKLIRAEAAAELGNAATAFQDINDLRTRAGAVTVPNGTSNSDLIDLIRNERRLELMGEGNRLHDLKRQAIRNKPDLKVRGIAPWDCNGMVCQIPDNELKGNPDMEPNPSGGCQ